MQINLTIQRQRWFRRLSCYTCDWCMRTKGPEKCESQEMSFATGHLGPGPPSVSAWKACWRVCRAVFADAAT